MEYIDGAMLSEVITKGKLNDRVDVIYGLASAVKALHDRDILHRDIKTENVMVKGQVVKLIDYGVSKIPDEVKLTVTHEFLGTKRYASPQAIEGHPPSKTDDLYSLGAVFYEIFSGRPLFDGIDNPAKLIDAIRNHVPDLFGVSSKDADFTYRLRLLIHRLLQKEARERPTIDEVLEWIKSDASPNYVKFLETHHRENYKGTQPKQNQSPKTFFARCEICNEAYILGKRDLEERGIEIGQLLRSLQRSSRVRVALTCGSCAQPFSLAQIGNRQQKYVIVELI
jgi:serine/threonine protein kinase